MSLLDTIKAFFCHKNESTAEEQPAAEINTPEVEKTPLAPVVVAEKLQIPEDSALKRHFLSALRAEVEAEMPPRPTESTLKRHHDSTIQAKMDSLTR